MGRSAREIIEAIPGGKTALQIYRKLKFSFYFRFIRDKEALFTDYYKRRVWDSHESYSGPGSTLSYTENLRSELPDVLRRYKVNHLLDAPCGDFNWMRKVLEQVNITYTGCDIVKPLIEENTRKFQTADIRFEQRDVTEDKLPGADLWLCRDCLIHFSNRDIKKALENFLVSDIPFLLTTTYPESPGNENISTGSHRFLNLELPPFNFPAPQWYLEDGIEEGQVKKMGLWQRSTIEAHVRKL